MEKIDEIAWGVGQIAKSAVMVPVESDLELLASQLVDNLVMRVIRKWIT